MCVHNFMQCLTAVEVSRRCSIWLSNQQDFLKSALNIKNPCDQVSFIYLFYQNRFLSGLHGVRWRWGRKITLRLAPLSMNISMLDLWMVCN
jgi:hypothetical protein